LGSAGQPLFLAVQLELSARLRVWRAQLPEVCLYVMASLFFPGFSSADSQVQPCRRVLTDAVALSEGGPWMR
jgi:hypothetical protein